MEATDLKKAGLKATLPRIRILEILQLQLYGVKNLNFYKPLCEH